ncbi:TPT-domain-containing protein [Dentipellis sp. KUC8613]|nr:TPT-domain-containing protein [Dentipellis sp. KUC8613]
MSTQHGYESPPPGYPLEPLHSGQPQSLHEMHLATVAEKKRLWWRNAFINGLFIASWFVFAILLSIYNKWMFSPEHFGFPFPLFVTTLHMFVQFLLAAVLRYGFPKKFRPEHDPTIGDYGRKAAPTAMATGLDIGLSNLSLRTITLSFYTMVKSSSLIFVLLFAFIFRLETFSVRLVGVILLIVCGVLLMVATETHFVLSGLLLVLSGSALSGLRWSLTQLLLRNKKMGLDNPAATLFWLSPVMGVTLAVISLVIDRWSTLPGSRFFDSFETTIKTCVLLFLPGVLAFSMVLSEYYIILRAGVVPMSIAGIAKEVTTITVSSWFFGDELTPLNITGVAITTCGIVLFTYHKYRKSVDSTVPLDAHGNPIEPERDLALDEEYQLVPDSESMPLVLAERAEQAGTDDRRSFDDAHRPTFTVEDTEEGRPGSEDVDLFESAGAADEVVHRGHRE